jgi:hypothetical protein
MSSNFLVNVNGILTDVLSIVKQKTVSTLELTNNNPTCQKYNMTFNQNVAIKTGDISVGLNGYCLNGSQTYTFGPSQPPLWVGASDIPGATGNTLVFSSNGITWYGLGNTLFSNSGWGICYNGRIWVGVSNTANSIAYSFNGTSWTGRLLCGVEWDYVRCWWSRTNFNNR